MRRKGVVLTGLLAAGLMIAATAGCSHGMERETGEETVQAEVWVDFSERGEEMIKPLHGVNNGPKTGYEKGKFKNDGTRFFKQAQIPYVRTHDSEYPYGQDLFIDIHCIFPDFSADPSLPESYHFAESDLYIQEIVESGSQVFFRLGESIDHSGNALYIDPPKDYEKWARICEGIINHYNSGFADGYHYDITYWEIWNEPEGGAMWTGTPEEFYELYKTAAVYLKERFPEIKIGGYGATVSKEDFFAGFMESLTKEEERVPLDFFSWHIYAADPSWLEYRAAQIRETLDQYGYEDAEIVLSEWNYNDEVWDEAGLKSEYKRVISKPRGAAYMAAALITLQNSGVDKAMYYDTQFFDIWNGLYTKSLFGSLKALPGLNSFSYFNELYQAGSQIAISSKPLPENLYLCAASDGERRLVMAANYGAETASAAEVAFHLENGYYASVTVRQTDERSPKGEETRVEGVSKTFTWTLPADSTALFIFE